MILTGYTKKIDGNFVVQKSVKKNLKPIMKVNITNNRANPTHVTLDTILRKNSLSTTAILLVKKQSQKLKEL